MTNTCHVRLSLLPLTSYSLLLHAFECHGEGTAPPMPVPMRQVHYIRIGTLFSPCRKLVWIFICKFAETNIQ